MLKIEDGNVVINVSDNKQNYSQRNNEIDPSNTCNTTNMVQALDYAGWFLPTDIYPKIKQPEDKLTKFCREDKRVVGYYKEHMPAMYNAWIKGDKNSYPPNEVHPVLAYATNLFMGCSNAVKFYSSYPIADFIKEIAVNNSPVVTSVKFGDLGHVITAVGVIFAKEDYDKYISEKYSMDNVHPKSIIYDDTYGKFDFDALNYKTFAGQSGNDSVMTWEQFIHCCKPVDNNNVKFAHIIGKPAAVA